MLCREAIEHMGFAAVGEGAQISDRATFYGIARIILGSHVRQPDLYTVSLT